eukprot:1660924-Lingulodinium_polyedra.AAC.1
MEVVGENVLGAPDLMGMLVAAGEQGLHTSGGQPDGRAHSLLGHDGCCHKQGVPALVPELHKSPLPNRD